MSTDGRDYADRLQALQHASWKRRLDRLNPYRRSLQRERLGATLDVGCGIGRQLGWLAPGSVGVDHNPHSVQVAREQGYDAFTVAQFLASEHARPGAFDAMLMAHVIEHMDRDAGLAILRDYVPFVRPGGTVMLICPQEVGYRSDATHVRFVDGEELQQMCREVGLEPLRSWSFPFPRPVGKVFIYNEFNVVARVPTT